MLRGVVLAALVLAAPALSGCGLPLPSGVQAPGRVAQERPREEQVVALPAGPAAGASARDIVEDFLVAQSSPEDHHAVAREFLAPDIAQTWDDDAGVQVYDAARPPVIEQTSNPEIVRVVAQLSATVSPEGVYQRAGREVTDDYRVLCEGDRCRIAALEPGLRLNPGDLGRSFAPRAVHFLAPTVGGTSRSGHLVADVRWLPRDDAAQRLVQAVLDGPSAALGDSARTAVPPGTRLLAPVTVRADGTVTVDLSVPADGLDALTGERLSAQLVWTLRGLGTGFRRLRLLSQGRPLEVDGSRAAQAAGMWQAYDPERLRSRAPALYLENRALRSLADGGLASSVATDGRLPVDVAASSPDGALALLTDRPDGRTDLRIGPQAGPFDDVRATGALSSPTWGSGEQGLFLLRDGEVVLVPPEGALVTVPVQTGERPVRRVRVSRDGVRVALLVGAADRPDLLLGRLEQGGAGPRVTGLREIVPTLTRVLDAAWETGTSLVVLARFPLGVLPARVAVDGSTAQPLRNTPLPQGVTPVSLTAAAGRPIVLSGLRAGAPADQQRLYRDADQAFRDEGPGRTPFYPG